MDTSYIIWRAYQLYIDQYSYLFNSEKCTGEMIIQLQVNITTLKR